MLWSSSESVRAERVRFIRERYHALFRRPERALCAREGAATQLVRSEGEFARERRDAGAEEVSWWQSDVTRESASQMLSRDAVVGVVVGQRFFFKSPVPERANRPWAPVRPDAFAETPGSKSAALADSRHRRASQPPPSPHRPDACGRGDESRGPLLRARPRHRPCRHRAAFTVASCMVRAGLPTARCPAGTSLVTTAPAESTAPSPTVTPG